MVPDASVMNGDQEPKAAADEFVEKADASIANAGK